MAEHDVPQVRAFALNDVEHAMSVALPARKMNRERSAAELGRARRASQHLFLGRREVLADPDLADDAGADLGLVLREAAVPSDRLGDRFDAHVLHVRRMRRFEVEARAHHDVEPGSPADPLQRGWIAADSEVGRIDDGVPAVFDEMIELLDRRPDVEQPAIVAIEKRVHPQVADHRDVERPLGDRDLRAAAGALPPARGVEQDMFVHQRDAHRLDGNGAEHRSDKSRMHADRRLRHVRARLLQLVRRPVRNRRKLSQIAIENDEALDDRRQERRHMGEDQAVADDRDGQRAEHRAEHRAAAAEQARSAEHDRGDDVEFEAPAGVRGSASEARRR